MPLRTDISGYERGRQVTAILVSEGIKSFHILHWTASQTIGWKKLEKVLKTLENVENFDPFQKSFLFLENVKTNCRKSWKTVEKKRFEKNFLSLENFSSSRNFFHF